MTPNNVSVVLVLNYFFFVGGPQSGKGKSRRRRGYLEVVPRRCERKVLPGQVVPHLDLWLSVGIETKPRFTGALFDHKEPAGIVVLVSAGAADRFLGC